MSVLLVIFGLLTSCLIDVLIGLIGSKRKLGFGWAFFLSVLLTPIVGLICVLISDPLPEGSDKKWGCLGILLAILAFILISAVVLTLIGALALF
ncbi:MAG: hypothetical protein GX664_01580 [Bacteroidales bacterium]|jgi:hypothetical protein|nr:hypothetical protein [Bacteroidales bacterium]